MKNEDAWQPLDPLSFSQYEKEGPLKNGKNREPDYNLFKLLYENSVSGEPDIFKPMYEPESSSGSVDADKEFKRLFSDSKKESGAVAEKKDIKESGDSESQPGRVEPADIEDAGQDEPVIDKEFAAGFEQGKQEGFDAGFEQGKKEGFELGKEEGFEQGKEEGYEHGEKTGEKQGYEQGEKEAKADGDAKAVEIIASLEDIFVKTENSWKEFVKRYENEIISLICKISEKVVFAKVEIDETLVRESIFHALEKLPEPEEITLHVSFDDYEYVEMIKEDFFEKIETLTTVSVVSNPGIKRCGCRIETSKADVETDIESSLNAVFSSITKAGLQ
ncbi:MAG: FliH/SctL family protein [Thermodesulfobacteriota bacterium]|nr:FliH/SctL family protein [Thermodesulfobacteriota bacterium]